MMVLSLRVLALVAVVSACESDAAKMHRLGTAHLIADLNVEYYRAQYDSAWNAHGTQRGRDSIGRLLLSAEERRDLANRDLNVFLNGR